MMRGNSKFTYTPPELKVPYQFQTFFTRQVVRYTMGRGFDIPWSGFFLFLDVLLLYLRHEVESHSYVCCISPEALSLGVCG
jgi:hypothetical protein